MPIVEFQPAGVLTEVASGTPIHEAAIRAGLHDLDLPCGAAGTCGQCLVEILGGGEDRFVLACQTKVNRDVVVRLPENLDTAMRVVGDSHFLLGGALTPLFSARRLTVPPASIEEHYSDWQRVSRELDCAVEPTLPVLRDLAGALREQDGRITIEIAEDEAVSVRAGHTSAGALGLAVDIGTTTVAAQLVSLDDGRVLATSTLYNQQIRRGADVISRIDYARTPERLAEVRDMALATVNGLIGNLCANPGDIRAAFMAGNTTMTHLFLGLPPRYIRESPYVPTANILPPLRAAEIGLHIHPEAFVRFAPGVGSYVGGDITAGLLSTELPTNHEDIFLFLDIGTNGEIVIGNADWLVACACSAGPAFEGSGIRCGMRATAGAVERLRLNEGGQNVEYEVIGGGKPAGICGSGLIALLGELFLAGVIDAAGHFNPGNPRLVEVGSRNGFVVEFADRTASGEPLVITEADIENLIRTKAAIYAACSLVLENVGLDWSGLARVYVAGGFGKYIRIADAVAIGMLPDLPHGRFSYIGNSALTGAYMALLSHEHRRRLAETAARMTYVDLSSDPRYMDSYVQAMFLPHTDRARFPSVAERRKT
jgi:uncharacterized 2Fe-2S/4Fe-4S cluster protein (DUF4445 family)